VKSGGSAFDCKKGEFGHFEGINGGVVLQKSTEVQKKEEKGAGGGHPLDRPCLKMKEGRVQHAQKTKKGGE